MEEDEIRIREAEDRRRAALVAVDMGALDALFAEDLVHIHSSGLVHDKAALLAYIAENRAFRAIERGPLRIRTHGDIAIMVGTMTNHMHVRGSDVTLHGLVTQVLRRETGAWRFVNFQLTLKGA